MPSSLPLLLPAGILERKTPVKNDPVFGDQSNALFNPTDYPEEVIPNIEVRRGNVL